MLSSLFRKPKAAKPKRGAVIVGGWLEPETGVLHYLKHCGPEHILCFAPTRSGKGVGLIVPTLLTLQDSVVVTDLKGENWALTAGYRRAAGQHVLMFNPTARPLEAGGKVAPEAGSVRYNPLTEIRLKSLDEIRDIQNIATILMDPTGTGKDGSNAHWTNSAIDLTTGALVHLLYSPDVPAEKKNLAGLLEFLSGMALATPSDPEADPTTEAFKALAEARHALPGEHYYWSVQADGTTTLTHPAVRDMAGRMLTKADRERGGVISSALANLSLFADPLVAANTSVSEFALSDLMHGDKPVSLYLVVPPGDQVRVRLLIRILLTQLIARLTESIEAKPKHNLLLLLDEFPAFGRLDAILDSIAFTAGYGIRMFLITQNLAQMKSPKAYGVAADSIISNCHIHIAYPTNEVSTAELLSKMCGTTTIHQQNISTSRDSMLSVAGKSHSISLQAISRPLLTPDECMRLPGPVKNGDRIEVPGDMLVFVAGSPPIYGKQSLWFKDETWTQRQAIKAPITSDVIRPAPAAVPHTRSAAAADAAQGADAGEGDIDLSLIEPLSSSPSPSSAPTHSSSASLPVNPNLSAAPTAPVPAHVERIEPYEHAQPALEPDQAWGEPDSVDPISDHPHSDDPITDEPLSCDEPADTGADKPAAPASASKPAKAGREYVDDFDVL